MIFTTTNVQQASLYQTIQVELESNPLAQDPAITAGDLVYFFDATADASTSCAYSTSPTATTFTVSVAGAGGFTGQVTLPVTATSFTVGEAYYLCYLSASGLTATVVRRGYVSTGEADSLTVWGAIYQAFAVSPSGIAGGEGVASLQITQSTQDGRPTNAGLSGTNTILLIPCGTSSAVTSDCASIDLLVSSCATVGGLSTTPTDVLALSSLTGQSLGVVNGSFVAPYSPSSGGYYICVPYCYSSSVGCGSSSTAMSYTVVAATTYTVSIAAATPGIYTREPVQPQARENGYMYFDGATLTTDDAVKVIRSTDSCASSTATLLTNLEVGTLEAVSSGDDGQTMRVSFLAPDLLSAALTGKVCYRRSVTGLWSSVYLSATNTVADFTISILQPTGFTIIAPSTTPSVGGSLTIQFAGSGLDGSADTAYLSASTEDNPCILSDLDTSADSSEIFICAMSGTTTPNCVVTVDPSGRNSAMTLAVCYKKTSNGQLNYAAVSGVVTLATRNPIYGVTPLPLFPGQTASVLFSGEGLSSSDSVKLVSPSGNCSEEEPALTTVTITAAGEVTAGILYNYTLFGTAETCIMICYRFSGTTTWVVTRSDNDGGATVSTCDATNLYISPFPLRYSMTNLGTGDVLTVSETATVQFTTLSGSAISSTIAPSAMRVVRATDSCVTSACDNVAACTLASMEADFSSTVTGSGSIYTAYLQVGAATLRYVICVQIPTSTNAYVPVLPATATTTTSTAFSFTANQANPVLASLTPGTWRVAMGTLQSVFLGTDLSAGTDTVYPILSSVALAYYTTTSSSTVVAVCPPISAMPSTLLTSSVLASGSTTTSTMVNYTRADRLYTGATVVLCYAWGSGPSRISAAGTVTISSAAPSSITWTLPSDGTGGRAGLPIEATFTSNSTTLSAINDRVYFYRYVQATNPAPSCYCNPTACSGGTFVSYDSSGATLTASTSTTNDQTIYEAPLGFRNYNYSAVFIVCYATSELGADTYMGQITIGVANPSYYTLTSVAGSLNRVGSPINITAIRRCVTTSCTALSTSDDMQLVPSTITCASLSASTRRGTRDYVDADGVTVVQLIGTPIVGSGQLSYQQSYVVNEVGSYHVCYLLSTDSRYAHLAFSSNFQQTTIAVTDSNPQQFVSVPASPSAYQFLTINLQCSSGSTLCSTCNTVRIVPGTLASCWEEVSGTYSSDSCLNTTSVQFPDQYLIAGTYTICFGGNYYAARRLPGTLTIAAENPSSYAPSSTSGSSIYTNQASNYVLDITGTSLSVDDTVFLLPTTGYSCHDLRTGYIQGNLTLSSWLTPSVSPYPLTLSGTTGVVWVVSNQSKRFSTGLLYDTSLCPGNGEPCDLKLCYRRTGMTWAPVTRSSTASTIQLVASSIANVTFDRYPLVIDMYAMVTVAGTDLLSSDTIVVHANSCTGTAVSVSVGTPTVNDAATQWIGVLRFNNSAGSYAVCRWRDAVATEIVVIYFTNEPTVSSILILSTPLYYALSPGNFSSVQTSLTQYEQLIVGATFSATAATNATVTLAQLISADTTVAECNYAPYYTAIGSTTGEFPVLLSLEAVTDSSSSAVYLYQGRLVVDPGTYALCMNTTSGLFRVIEPPPSATRDRASQLVLGDASPASYTVVPSNLMATQQATLTFTAGTVALAAGDAVAIITGTLYDCGFSNSTVVAAGLITLESEAYTITLAIPQTLSDGTVLASASLTVCYGKNGATFATTPRSGLADQNLVVISPVPTAWTSSPTQAQVNNSLSIIFAGDTANENYLTADDAAFLVEVDAGTTPDDNICWAYTLSGSTAPTIITNGAMTKVSGTANTQWTIPTSILPEGTFAVCYTAVANGRPLYVNSPATLVVYPVQSPTGAYTGRSSTALIDSLTVAQGARFYLLFNTSVALNVALDNGVLTTAELEEVDAVRVTTDAACATSLTEGEVDVIPTSFAYADLDLVDPTTNLAIPYLHLRVRASVGDAYYICMRRTGRESWQAYYDYEVVAGFSVKPAVMSVTVAPVASFTASPTSPRVWVPNTTVSVTYGTGFSLASVVQFFFVPYNGSSVTDANEMNYDGCYQPPTTADAVSASVALVNTTLQVTLTTMRTQYSFSSAQTYLLCYEMADANIASVFPSSLVVMSASPIYYQVPDLIATSTAFTMGFTAISGIFTSASNGNVAQIYKTTDIEATPSCVGATAPTTGTTGFTTFSITNTTYAVVQPVITESGYYYVCFLTYDQTQYFAVPNNATGYVFPVDLWGAQYYRVNPSPGYLGQLLDLTISGNRLSSSDYVKIVRVLDDPSSGSSTDYSSSCTADAANADASATTGSAGTAVSSDTSGLTAHYYPRVNTTGTFVLCYQSALLESVWKWVDDLNHFNVYSARPAYYALQVTPMYETEVVQLYVYDTDNSGLQDGDAIKLVDRTSGFDCTASAASSTQVGLLSYLSAESNSSVHVYELCGSATASVTVCYSLSGSGTWAEVPRQSPPPTYLFEPVNFTADPFTGPLRVLSTGTATEWTAPRPYEPFSFTFTTATSSTATVLFVGFAMAPVTVCAATAGPYITPLYYEAVASESSTFEVVLSQAGSYALYLGTRSNVLDPNITHATELVVGPCDPCSVAPPYSFIGGTATLSFPSNGGGTLATTDALRIIPVSQGLTGRPCESPEGPYASSTFDPTSSSTTDETQFSISTGTTAEASTYLGEYYLCYRKSSAASSSDNVFAVVADDTGTPAIFSIYPTDLLTAATCPSPTVFALETAVYNVTVLNSALYPDAAFSANDAFVLVPENAVVDDGGCSAVTSVDSIVTATSGRAVAATLDNYSTAASNWYATFPSESAATSFYWCFKLEYDTIFRSLSTTLQIVSVENPDELTTAPPVPLVGSTGVVVTITGTGLASTDDVYVVSSTESCSETCDHLVTPTSWTGVTTTATYVNSTTVQILFGGAVTAVTTVGVCYRRTGRYLTRLGNVSFLEPNPISYAVNFVPRVGTRPTLTFTGVDLTNTDAMMIVEPGAMCYTSNAVAVGEFVSVSDDGTTTAFYLPLTNAVAQEYAVCYEVSTVGAYVTVSPDLSVLAGGPSSFVASNTPMRGRATVLSFPTSDPYQPEAGDDVYLACPGCSCFDGEAATIPYGTPTATATSDGVSLRVGIGDTQSYPVCYRRSGSGYAQVGGLETFVTPVYNAPNIAARFPESVAYQGQRLSFNFTNFTTATPSHLTDDAILVTAERTCWENTVLNADGVVVGPTNLTSLMEDGSIASWLAHVPSLGPDVPSDSATLFPLSYALCYRECCQGEFVSVPYVIVPQEMQAADPVTYTTSPTTVEQGMLDVAITFSIDGGQSGDVAYAVQFTTLTDTVCTDAASTVIANEVSAYPTFTISIPGDAVIGSDNTALCYVRFNATVAEVPQLLDITQGNPSGYTTNVQTDTSVARERQYITVTVTGTGLSSATDTIAFTDVPCGQADRPIASSSYLARIGDATSTDTTYTVVTQFIAPSSPTNMYVCYSLQGTWHEVGAALSLAAPQPTTVDVYSGDGSAGVPRAGQNLYLQLSGGVTTVPIGVAVLSGNDTIGAGTWCHNFTTSDIQETSLVIESAALFHVPVWEVAGLARLCVKNTDADLWADVATTVAATVLEIYPANPTSMTVYPSPPRVGQQVTLTFDLIVAANAADVVKITAVSYDPCETADSVAGFAAAMTVTVLSNTSTSITLVSSLDSLNYYSFNASGSYRVCYYSATEEVWAVVGGSVAAGTVTVEERVPQSWAVASGDVLLGFPFAISLTDSLGLLMPTDGEDLVWATPSTMNCGVDPYGCAKCVVFSWNTTESTSSLAVTTSNASVVVQEMNVCYRLKDATAALVPGTLNVTAGPIQCVVETTIVPGLQQTVTFDIENGVDVTSDSWRLSFYATTALSCSDRYVPSFVLGMATLQSTTSSTATYSVVWPVGLSDAQYTLCYTHNGVTAPICTCDQISAQTGECFLTVGLGSPQSFTPVPQPTYVGQYITLDFAINSAMVAFPPQAVKLVAYESELTSCSSTAAFVPSDALLVRISDTQYTYAFQHNYLLGTSNLIVCVLTSLSTNYARVASTVSPSSPTANNTLWIRPYLQLSTFPSSADYIRVMQTLNISFTMSSQESDDLVSSTDQFTIATSPANCIESVISQQGASAMAALFDLSDSAFLTLPTAVLSANATAFESKTLATFAEGASGNAYTFCYKLAAGTWAPVLPILTILPAAVDTCSVTASSTSSSVQAMYYAPTTLTGGTDFSSLYNATNGGVRVVPQSQWCTNDAAVVFTIDTSASAATSTAVSAVFFAPATGTYKICLRLNSTTNWSPTCTSITVTAASPTGESAGCWNIGQAVDVTVTQTATGLSFGTTDTLRFIEGRLPCLFSNGTAAPVTATVLVGDAVQSTGGLVLSSVTTGQTSFTMPYIVLLQGTTALRLCYTNANGDQFAVPLNYSAQPTQSTTTARARQPATVLYNASTPQVGYRVFLNFTAAAATTQPLLDPYAAPPSPYVPGPAYNGDYDAFGMLALDAATVYVDGRCAAAVRSGSLSTAAFQGVYGAVMTTTGGVTYVPYTIGNFDPTTAAVYYVACYQLATCGVVDSGAPMLVLPSNPSSVYTVQTQPRRGQLIQVYFVRDTSTTALTPNADRGAKQAGLASCWTLSSTAGQVVTGTVDLTSFVTIFYAQEPALRSDTETRSCYQLAGRSWSEVPDGVGTVLAANPTAFVTTPTSARVSQVNLLSFQGSGFGANDRVKIIALAANCSNDAVPPTTILAYISGTATTPTAGTAQGWSVAGVSSDSTTATLNFTATETGTFSVCYRLAADSVWTLVYNNLTIYPRDPAAVTQTPAATLEGELFTLLFSSAVSTSSQGVSAMSSNDRIVLYYGSSVNCLAPTEAETAPSITASPSRTDNLPANISFQLSAGTRGDYTICYLIASASAGGSVPAYVPVWNFDVVAVQPNPSSIISFPPLASTTAVYRQQQLISLVFSGFGLMANATETDAVQLLSAATSEKTDAACQTAATATNGVYYHAFSANGTMAVQVVRITTAVATTVSAEGYYLCYKLYGGQFHVMDEVLTVAGAAAPSGATSPKLSGSSATAVLASGESMSWTLADVPDAGCVDGAAVLFYSAVDCNDVLYYTDVAAAVSDDLTAIFPTGAAVIEQCSGATLVRLATNYVLVAASMDTTLSLCYWASSTDALAVVLSDVITPQSSAPAPLSTTLVVAAHQLFSISLDVSPTVTDWVVFVTDPVSCVGTTTAPTNAADATVSVYNAATGTTVVTAALPAAGRYYLCYSHQDGICAPSTGRECARVVGEVMATAGNPSSWLSQPSPVYATETLGVTFSFSDSTAAASQSAATTTAWMVWVAAADSVSIAAATMNAVMEACIASAVNATMQIPLAYDSTSGTWAPAAAAVSESGQYALCYLDTTLNSVGDTAPISLFAPVKGSGPLVSPSAVTEVIPPTTITTSGTMAFVLVGGGMSAADVVVAVGVSSDVIPSDICSDDSLVPRVVSTSATAGSGLRTMVRYFGFSATGRYVLCYTAAAEAEAGASGTLITDTAFAVSPTVVSVTVISLVQLVDLPLELRFSGTSLAVTDTAALVYVAADRAGMPVALTVDSICLNSSLEVGYSAMTSVAEDGTTALYSSTPTAAGIYMVCFRATTTSTPLLMAEQITIGQRTAASVAFTVQPGSCEVLLACGMQPTITLLNSSGLPASEPYTTVEMALYFTNGTATPTGYLAGGQFYTQVNYTTFTFGALRIGVVGSFQMVATATVPGGETLQTTSATFDVTDGGVVQKVAQLDCDPASLLDRTASDASLLVQCTITPLLSDGPTAYTVAVSSGSTTDCVATGSTEVGAALCGFTVTAPGLPTDTNPLVNYIAISATPEEGESVYANWPVEHSPLYVRLTTFPTSATTLSCTPGNTTGQPPLTVPGLIRVGDKLLCGLQGVALVAGQNLFIVAPPQDLKAETFYDADASGATAVDLGTSPVDLNGRYNFTLTMPSTRWNVTVEGSVPTAEGSTTWVAATDSPVVYVILGNPTAAATTLSCVSNRTASARWYTPAEPLYCTVHLADSSGAVNGVQSDFSILLADGGSVAAVNGSTYGTQLSWNITAPPRASAATATVDKRQRALPAGLYRDDGDDDDDDDRSDSSYHRHYSPSRNNRSRADAAGEMGAAFAIFHRGVVADALEAVMAAFTVQVQYVASTTTASAVLTTYTGELVYVTAFQNPLPTFTAGQTVSLTLTGVGLMSTHRYVMVSATTATPCSKVFSEATATLAATAGTLVLTFTVPGSSFMICFGAADAMTVLQPLDTTQWTPVGTGGESGWTTDDLILLIVGVVLLFVLLVLLLVLLWCLCGGGGGGRSSRRYEEERVGQITHATLRSTSGGEHVYMPPRANHRFVALTSRFSMVPPEPTPPTTPLPPPPEQTTTPTPVAGEAAESSATRVNIHIKDTTIGEAAPPVHRTPSFSTATATTTTNYTTSSSSLNSRDGVEVAGAGAPSGKKRHHTKRHRHGGTKRGSGYGDLDAATHLATPTGASPPTRSLNDTADLVHSPRGSPLATPPPPLRTHTTPTPSLPMSRAGLPPLPSAPVVSSGPYQHLHHAATAVPPLHSTTAAAPENDSQSGNRTIGAATARPTRSVLPESADTAAEAFAGPFVVAGHTSRPMVRSTSAPPPTASSPPSAP